MKFKRKKLVKILAMFMAVNMLANCVLPTFTYALTSGPSQPEVQSFEPAGTTEMVDLFSGDFTYNIPLFELPGPNGGYPFNLAYHAGIGMDQEASWVGLGWNLNPGAIVRQMRGVPDEFKGDTLIKEVDMKPNITYGGSLEFSVPNEIWGKTVQQRINLAKVFNPNSLGNLNSPINYSVNLGINYNNYKGVGFSIGGGINQALGTKFLKGVGLNANLSSDGGPSLRPSLSFSSQYEKTNLNYNLGLGFSSRRGLTELSLGVGLRSIPYQTLNKESNKKETKNLGVDIGGSATISLAGNAYTPSIQNAMKGFDVGLRIKGGFATGGFFWAGGINGHYSREEIRDKKAMVKAYGYSNLQEADTDNTSIVDFNREKDGAITSSTQFMGIPSLTYDVYSVNGQGMSAMYRPFRSEVGAVRDPHTFYRTAGGKIGAEIGPGNPMHIGVDLDLHRNTFESGAWEENKGNNASLRFSRTKNNGDVLYQPSYFKNYGESTTDKVDDLTSIGGKEPVRLALADFNSSQTAKLETGRRIINTSPFNNTKQRESRNTVILPIKNEQLKNGKALGEYEISYTDGGLSKKIKRQDYKDHHTAGFSVANPDGMRYVYGLPAYNKKQVECQFSVKGIPKWDSHSNIKMDIDYGTTPYLPRNRKLNYKGGDYACTDEYYSRTETPAFPHSFMLTSILGTDYVDADEIPGPSEGDLGYWVKFSYKKTANNFKWRAPFYGANYNKGLYNQQADDKGSYMYGEKEIWYLEKAETKSHIAVFYTSERVDARGAFHELQNYDSSATARTYGHHEDGLGDKLHKLDRISLFSKLEFLSQNNNASPITTVHLEYSDSLCRKLPNNENDGYFPTNYNSSGKLTLKKLYFTYQKNTRGELSPYLFDYHANNAIENPDYDGFAYDRWGNYKPYTNIADNTDFPYVNQQSNYANRHLYAGAWSLKEITMPSGALIKVEYESDDYGYVQNKTAMQMTKIRGVGSMNSEAINHTNFKLYFDLEKPISSSLSVAQQQEEIRKYLDDSGQIYFKAKTTLKKEGSGTEEMISGYAEVDLNLGSMGVETSSLQGGGYQIAYVTLKPIVSKTNVNYHPISVAAWQHLEYAQPQIITNDNNKTCDSGRPTAKKIVDNIKSLVSTFAQVFELFTGYYAYANLNYWGERVDLNKAWVRLNSPDKIKYGGGLRVKSVVLNDKWKEGSIDNQSFYGQVYEYTTQENGQTISSGVAAYEPMIGGDEIALRIGKKYNDQLVGVTEPTHFFEFPINEDCYPGPQVGYSKVTVKSLASASKEGLVLPTEVATYFGATKTFASTGAAVHEFYTAKDFPIVSAYTGIARKQTPPIWTAVNAALSAVPYLKVNITDDRLAASQGYVTEVNDMHGKPKKITYFGQDIDGKLLKSPVSSVNYNYKHEFRTPEGSKDKVMVPTNQVPTLVSDKNGITIKENRILGQDYELFADSRYMRNEYTSGGVQVNVEIGWAGVIPLPMPFPNFSATYSSKQLRSYVLNKIIHRSGILESTEAFDGSATVKTTNLLWDAQTGEVLLSSVNNNFERPIYTYNIPAHYQYDRMGAAFKNIGLYFLIPLIGGANGHYTSDGAIDDLIAPHLVVGDEFIVDNGKGKIILTKMEATSSDKVYHFYSKNYNLAGNAALFLYRSGRRNLLSAKVGSITALVDPTNMNNRKKDNTNKSQFIVPTDCKN
jgi:hypothetical protein